MTHRSFQLFKIRIIQHHSLTMILIRLLIGPMHGNLDPSKQAPEAIFSKKFTKDYHPAIYFNNIPVTQTTVQKHMYLGEKLNYNTHTKERLSKIHKGIGILRNLSNKLPR